MPCEREYWKGTNKVIIKRIPQHEGGGWLAFSDAFGRANPGDGETPLDALADLQAVLDLLTAQAQGGKK